MAITDTATTATADFAAHLRQPVEGADALLTA